MCRVGYECVGWIQVCGVDTSVWGTGGMCEVGSEGTEVMVQGGI